MTTRVYLASASFTQEQTRPTDLPAERIFVNASEVPEVWVETESSSIGEIGRAVSFYIGRSHDIGFNRVSGTIERKLQK